MATLFWRYFFRLLLLTAAISQWACLAWVLTVMAGLRPPLWLHVAAPLLLHAGGRWVLLGADASALRRLRGASARNLYVRVVFASMFGMVALLVTAVLWALAGAGVELAAIAGLAAEPARTQAAVTTGAHWLGSAGLLAMIAMVVHGYGRGQRHVRIQPLEVLVAGLAPAFDGYRIVQLSDVHIGSFMDAEALRPYVEQANALSPDLICITGDITDGLDHADETFPVLGRLRARDGVLAILGNHDMYTGAQRVAAALARHTDFTLLRDARAVIERNGGRLHVLGLDDRGLDWARGVPENPALVELCAQVPAGQPIVLLSHRPDLFEQAVALEVPLVLAGHTHGGQLALPWPLARPASMAHFMTRYPRGTFVRGDTTLHVNLGLGVTGQPVRVLTPREITVITLRCGKPAQVRRERSEEEATKRSEVAAGRQLPQRRARAAADLLEAKRRRSPAGGPAAGGADPPAGVGRSNERETGNEPSPATSSAARKGGRGSR